MKKSILFSVHAVSGLFSGLFILALSLSGSLLVFHDEFDKMQQPSFLRLNIGEKDIPLDSCYRIIKNKYPVAAISSCDMATGNKQPVSFSIYDASYREGNSAMQVFLHPQTGEILKTRGGSEDNRQNFMSWLAAFHNSFHLGKTGEWLLGFLGIIFIVSIISGTILYRKKIIPVLLFRKSLYNKNNLHQLVGTWALAFNLVIAITGTWMQRYVFKPSFYNSSTWTRTIKPSTVPPYSIDTVLNQLHTTYPAFTARVIYFSKSGCSIYGSNHFNSFIHSDKFADRISIDSAGHIQQTAFIDSIDAGSRYDIVNSQIHFGRYGGLPLKIIYSLFGLMSGILAVTGFLIWWKK